MNDIDKALRKMLRDIDNRGADIRELIYDPNASKTDPEAVKKQQIANAWRSFLRNMDK